MGDLLFSCVNLARHLKLDAEANLRQANSKFERRFRAVEARAGAAGQVLQQLSAEELDSLWEAVKAEEADGP
jgi:ATP diphosphatase